MAMPTMSLVMVINGPVASAGSIFNRSSVRGTNVPNKEANKTTLNSDSVTAIVVTSFAPNEKTL